MTFSYFWSVQKCKISYFSFRKRLQYKNHYVTIIFVTGGAIRQRGRAI